MKRKYIYRLYIGLLPFTDKYNRKVMFRNGFSGIIDRGMIFDIKSYIMFMLSENVHM